MIDQTHCPGCGHGVLDWNTVCPNCDRLPWDVWRLIQLQRRAKFIWLLPFLLMGGVGSAASIGIYLHTTHLKHQALQAEQVSQPVSVGETLRFNLKNGSTIEAKLKAIKDTWVKIEADELGEVTLPKDQIAAVNRGKGQPFPVEVAFPIRGGRSSTQPYLRTEQEAQRALEHALRNNDGQQAEAMRATIKQFRKAQPQERHRLRASEGSVAKMTSSSKEDSALEREVAASEKKWETTINREHEALQTTNDRTLGSWGEPVVFKKQAVGSSPLGQSIDTSYDSYEVTPGSPDQVRWEDSKDEHGDTVRKMYQTGVDGQDYPMSTTTYVKGTPTTMHGEQIPCYKMGNGDTSLEPTLLDPSTGQVGQKTTCTKWTTR